jgi:hypothetical protein
LKRLRILAGLALSAAALQGQEKVTITDLGPGPGGRILQDALARPHRLIPPDTSRFELPRGAEEPASLIVLGRGATIAGNVDGDVIVVGGELFIRPGARISGRAVAIGGGVYPSALASVGRGTLSFYDYTYEIFRTTEGYRLDYRSLREDAAPSLIFPGIYGFRLPEYDRVNGMSISFGPAFSFMEGRGELNGVVTYRSDLGKVDPAAYAALQLNRRVRATARIERGTFSNEAWIWSNFVNSLSVLAFGFDTRNYYRADRADAFLFRLWETPVVQLEPFVGARIERAWSVGPVFGENRGPWSVFGRTDTLGIWRPNPQIAPGNITSVLAGGAVTWGSPDVKLRARSRAEMALGAPATSEFTQLTSDLEVTFPTFGTHEYGLDIHWVTTPTEGAPPPQRFHYLGGNGTLTFLDLLEQGGDELLLIDQRYAIPLPNVRLGLLGMPTLQLRHRIGSAGLGALPDFEQMVGFAVSLRIIRAEIQLDPASGRTRVGIGFTFSR